MNKLTQEFLTSLAGLPLPKAYQAVTKGGFNYLPVEVGTALAAVAIPNTVVVWYNENEVVVKATAGDPVELR